MTVSNLSGSIVEATSMKEAIGFVLPILLNYIKAVAAVDGASDLSFGIIIYRASTVYSDLNVLAA